MGLAWGHRMRSSRGRSLGGGDGVTRKVAIGCSAGHVYSTAPEYHRDSDRGYTCVVQAVARLAIDGAEQNA